MQRFYSVAARKTILVSDDDARNLPFVTKLKKAAEFGTAADVAGGHDFAEFNDGLTWPC
ncbi:MAG TPA: hypothetical protein VGP72_26960 [Planctomycetota bacterium]